VVPDETEPNADEPSDDLPSPSSFGFSPVRSSSGLPYPDQTPATRDDLPDRGLPGAPAAWGLRALARILDYMLFSLVFGYLAALLGTEVESDGDISGPTWPLLLFPIFFMIYETTGLAIFGQTIGKWVCQVKAVRYSNGELAELSSTAVRAFIPGIFVLIAAAAPMFDIPALGYLQFVAVLIYLASVADILYRGPHDKAAGTIVLASPRPRRTRLR